MRTTAALFAFLVAVATAALAGASCGRHSQAPTDSAPTLLPFEPNMPSLEGATGWINSAPLKLDELRGKVVVVDFWTYTCSNWMRTAPYLRLWAEKYKSAGLVVIGVHSPEFSFEQDSERVRRFTAVMHLDFPIAIDSRHAIWRAFDNQYWPALYFLDSQGRIRHRQFGEADYDKAEVVLQGLLKEAGARGFDTTIVPVVGQGSEAAADWADLKTPETYTGYARTERFASPGDIHPSEPYGYAAPARLLDNQWALAGNWTISGEAAHSNSANAQVLYRFHARDLHVVMGSSATHNQPVHIRVRVDGKPPGAAHGSDIDADGVGTVSEYRLYQLIRQSPPIKSRQIEILFLDGGVDLFSFAFG